MLICLKFDDDVVRIEKNCLLNAFNNGTRLMKIGSNVEVQVELKIESESD